MCFCLHCTPDTIISFENYNPGITESGGPWRCAELLPQLHLSLNQANRFDFHLFKDVGAFSTFSFRLFRYRDYCYAHVHLFSDTRTLIIVKQLYEYVKDIFLLQPNANVTFTIGLLCIPLCSLTSSVTRWLLIISFWQLLTFLTRHRNGVIREFLVS